MVTPPQWMAPSLPKARLKMPRTQPQKPMTARTKAALLSVLPSRENRWMVSSVFIVFLSDY